MFPEILQLTQTRELAEISNPLTHSPPTSQTNLLRKKGKSLLVVKCHLKGKKRKWNAWKNSPFVQ